MRIRPAQIVFTAAATAYLLIVSLSLALIAPAGTAAAADTGQTEDAPETVAERAGVSTERGALPPGVLVMVNDRPITSTLVNTVARQLDSNGQSVDSEQIIDELINLELLTEAAEELAIDQRPDIAAALQLQYVQTMANAYLASLSGSLQISDAQLQAAYRRRMSTHEPLEYRTRHILVQNEEHARSIIRSLDEGAEFGALARELSTGPSAATGGDLGWLGGAAMVPEYGRAVQELDVGEYSREPVHSEYGWHVIRVDDTREVPAPGFEASRRALRQRLLRQALEEQVAALRAAAHIER